MRNVLLDDLKSLVKCERIVIQIASNFNCEFFIYFKQKKSKLYLYVISEHNNVNTVSHINTIISYIAKHIKTNTKYFSHVRSENNCHVFNFKGPYKKINFTDYLIDNKRVKTNVINIKCALNEQTSSKLVNVLNKDYVDGTFINNEYVEPIYLYKFLTHNHIHLIYRSLDFSLFLREPNDE